MPLAVRHGSILPWRMTRVSARAGGCTCLRRDRTHRLSLDPCCVPPVRHMSTAMNDTEPVNILMVDDQPSKLLTYEVILRELGEHLLTAHSGREALDLL